MDRRRGHEIPPEVLDRFVTGDATAGERANVMRHVLARCMTCSAHLYGAGWPTGTATGSKRTRAAGPPPGAYDSAFAAAEQRVRDALAHRQWPVGKLLAELERLPADSQAMRVRNVRRFASTELALALIARSHELRYADGGAMLHYAGLAVAAAEAASAEQGLDSRLLADCRARAWGQLANAQRVRSDLREAERSFAVAMRFVDEGSGDPELRATMLSYLSSLRVYQRDFDAAISLLTESVGVYREFGHRPGEARGLIGLALARIYSGNPEPALAELLRALDLLRGGDADLIMAATSNLVLCYVDLGRPLEAYDMIAAGERQLESCDDEITKLRWNWLRGMVDRDLGLYGAAALRLNSSRDGFVERDMSFEVALVSLELADLYARQQRVADVLRMVADAIPILQGLGVTREIIAALMKLREIAHEQQAAVALVRQVLTALRPGLQGAKV